MKEANNRFQARREVAQELNVLLEDIGADTLALGRGKVSSGKGHSKLVRQQILAITWQSLGNRALFVAICVLALF